MKKRMISMVALACMAMWSLVNCSPPGTSPSDGSPPLSDEKAVTAFSFPALGATAIITETGHTIAVTVPYGTNVTALVAEFSFTGQSVKVGSTVQTSGVTANNFASPVTYTAVAENGSTQEYVVTVTVALNTEKAITAFSFPAQSATGTITEASHTIAVTVPYGTSVTALVATFSTTGQSVKVASTVQTSGVTANNFSSPVTYTVFAADNSTQDYVVTVTVALNSAKAITAFSFPAQSATGTITEASHTIAVTVPFGTSVSALVAAFSTTGQSVKVGSTTQTSGVTANNFSSPVTYTVAAADDSTQDYVVTVTVALNPAKAITAFSFPALSVTGTITEASHAIAVKVPYGTNVTALVAAFSTTGQSVKVGSTTQTSGVTANNFSSPVTYTVVAADASTQDYVVTVTPEPAPQMSIEISGPTVIPSGTGSFSFGWVYNRKTRSQTFSLYNRGPAGSVLRLSGSYPVQVSSTDSDCFVVSQPVSTSISSGGYTTFSITFTPANVTANLKSFTGTVNITSNDPVHNPYTFALTANTFFSSYDTHGTTGTGTGQFDTPVGVAYNPVNSVVYVADRYRARILMFDSAGSFKSEFVSASLPESVAVDSSGNVYVANSGGGSAVQKFDKNGTLLTSWGAWGTADGQIKAGMGIAVGPGDEVFVSDLNNNRVQVFSSSGVYSRKWSVAQPYGIYVFPGGAVLVWSAQTYQIWHFDSVGGDAYQWASSSGQWIGGNSSLEVFASCGDWIEVFDNFGALVGGISARNLGSGLRMDGITGIAFGGGYLYFLNASWGAPDLYGNNMLVRVKR